MDNRELDELRRFPDKILTADSTGRLKSKIWACALCSNTKSSEEPVVVPKQCQCGSIFWKAVTVL